MYVWESYLFADEGRSENKPHSSLSCFCLYDLDSHLYRVQHGHKYIKAHLTNLRLKMTSHTSHRISCLKKCCLLLESRVSASSSTALSFSDALFVPVCVTSEQENRILTELHNQFPVYVCTNFISVQVFSVYIMPCNMKT